MGRALRQPSPNFVKRKLPSLDGITDFDKSRLDQAASLLINYHALFMADKFKNDIKWYEKVKNGGIVPQTDAEKQKFQELRSYDDEIE